MKNTDINATENRTQMEKFPNISQLHELWKEIIREVKFSSNFPGAYAKLKQMGKNKRHTSK